MGLRGERYSRGRIWKVTWEAAQGRSGSDTFKKHLFIWLHWVLVEQIFTGPSRSFAVVYGLSRCAQDSAVEGLMGLVAAFLTWNLSSPNARVWNPEFLNCKCDCHWTTAKSPDKVFFFFFLIGVIAVPPLPFLPRGGSLDSSGRRDWKNKSTKDGLMGVPQPEVLQKRQKGGRMKNKERGREQIYGKGSGGKWGTHRQGGLDAKRTEAEAIARLICSFSLNRRLVIHWKR